MKRIPKAIGLLFLFLASLCLLYVWAELAYRRVLYSSYGSEPYANHVDDLYFSVLPARAQFGAVCAAIAFVFMATLRDLRLAVACVLLAVSGWIAPRLLDYYHRSLILVTYTEFAAATFGEHPK
ncbi:MAG: hypothetical protein NTV08_08135 [Verrucomicrobia bacterium]|nr:hypothetical protein [Verrucomicrobiota bacterium]